MAKIVTIRDLDEENPTLSNNSNVEETWEVVEGWHKRMFILLE